MAIVVAARLTLGWEVLGLLPGIGAMCLLIAALNVGEETEIWPWAVAGAVFSAGGVVLYSALRRLTPRLTDFPPASR